MNNSDDDSSLLGYNSSAPDIAFVEQDLPTPQDEVDMPALVQVLRILKKRKAYYNSNEALTTDESTFTIKQQLAVVQQMNVHIAELETLITSTINKVREKQNERY